MERVNEKLYQANIDLVDKNKVLEKEIEQLKQRLEIEIDISDGMLKAIDKAIEFIYENAYDVERKTCIDDLWREIPELLEILKGANNNEQ